MPQGIAFRGTKKKPPKRFFQFGARSHLATLAFYVGLGHASRDPAAPCRARLSRPHAMPQSLPRQVLGRGHCFSGNEKKPPKRFFQFGARSHLATLAFYVGLGHASRDPAAPCRARLSRPHAMPQSLPRQVLGRGHCFSGNEKKPPKRFFQFGARKRTRTSTPLPAPGPEPGASTNSAIRAMVAKAACPTGPSRKMRPNHSEICPRCPLYALCAP